MVSMVEYPSSDWIRGHTPGLFRSFQLGWISAKDSRDNPAKLGRSICCSMSTQARAQRYFLPSAGWLPDIKCMQGLFTSMEASSDFTTCPAQPRPVLPTSCKALVD